MSSGVLAAWGTSPPGPADWRHEAACLAHDAEKWFPIGTTGPAIRQMEEAIAVCMGCPVRAQCLRYALDNRIVDGIWGGMGEDERQSLKRRSERAQRAADRGGYSAARAQPDPVEVALAAPRRGQVPATSTAALVAALRDNRGHTWRHIGRTLAASESTVREVYAGTRTTVTRATENIARALAEQAGLVSAE